MPPSSSPAPFCDYASLDITYPSTWTSQNAATPNNCAINSINNQINAAIGLATGALVGIIIGGIVLLILIIVGIAACCCGGVAAVFWCCNRANTTQQGGQVLSASPGVGSPYVPRKGANV